MFQKWALTINSALAFASAELVNVALHETGHGLVAQALGFKPKIYAYYENNPTGTTEQSLLILAGGPVVSLVLGSLFLLWYRRSEPRYAFGRLVLFWLAWLGIMEFVNYLIVTPFLTAGDTAQFADLLHAPVVVRYAVAIVGIVIMVALTGPAAQTMYAVAPPGVALDTSFDRRRYIMRGFYLPLIIGTVLTGLGGIGGPLLMTGIGMFGTFGNIDVIAFALFRAGVPAKRRPAKGDPLRIEPLAFGLFVALVLVYIFVIGRGLPV